MSRAIPEQLFTRLGSSGLGRLRQLVANVLGHAEVELANVDVRRTALPSLPELGPASSISEHLTFPQLHTEWSLHLTYLERYTWEASLPRLAADIRDAPTQGLAAA